MRRRFLGVVLASGVCVGGCGGIATSDGSASGSGDDSPPSSNQPVPDSPTAEPPPAPVPVPPPTADPPTPGPPVDVPADYPCTRSGRRALANARNTRGDKCEWVPGEPIDLDDPHVTFGGGLGDTIELELIAGPGACGDVNDLGWYPMFNGPGEGATIIVCAATCAEIGPLVETLEIPFLQYNNNRC